MTLREKVIAEAVLYFHGQAGDLCELESTVSVKGFSPTIHMKVNSGQKRFDGSRSRNTHRDIINSLPVIRTYHSFVINKQDVFNVQLNKSEYLHWRNAIAVSMEQKNVNDWEEKITLGKK